MKQTFIEKAKEKHGNRFNYSKVVYKNRKTNVIIICPIHGEFSQNPYVHLNGKGCPKCHLDSLRKTTEQFIKEAIKIHGEKYNYSKVEYKGSFSKVKIICPIHGEFEQIASDHTNNKKGCRKCYLDNNSKDLNNFIKESEIIHNKKYDYSLIKSYHTNMDKVKIICPEHGEFEQRPYCHTIKKQGCPHCPTIVSKPHQEIIDYLKLIYTGNIEINDRKVLNGFELDIFIPDKNLAIEYNGLFWHSFDKLEVADNKKRHQKKCDLCDTKGINLFQIWEHEWFRNKCLIKSMINNKIGNNHKIYARKCKIVSLKSSEYKKFLMENHLQGPISNPIRYGLEYDGHLVCVAGFSKHKKYDWEIGRFATLKFISVVGGAGKLLHHFIKTHNPNSILSYANRNHSNGKLYHKLGFELIGTTQPGYFYTKKSIVYSRQQFQKHKLADKLDNFDPNLSEAVNMFNNGYRRFWNAGNLKFIKFM